MLLFEWSRLTDLLIRLKFFCCLLLLLLAIFDTNEDLEDELDDVHFIDEDDDLEDELDDVHFLDEDEPSRNFTNNGK